MHTRRKKTVIVVIYTAVVFGAIYIFLAHSAFLYPTFNAIDSSPFLASFAGDFIAGLFITILATFFIPAYLDWRKRPLLEFKNRATRNNICTLSSTQDGKWEGTFELAVQNDGSTTQRDVYWHLLIIDDLNPSMLPFGDNPVPLGSDTLVGLGKTWKHFMGRITDPMYPHRSFIFPFTIKIKSTTGMSSYKIHYYFTAEFGASPARANKFFEIERAIGRDADNAFKPEYLSHLSLEAKKE